MVEEAGVGDALHVARCLEVGQEVDPGDDFLGGEGDEDGRLAGIAADAVGGGLGVDGVAEEFVVCVVDFGPFVGFLDALHRGEGADEGELDAVGVVLQLGAALGLVLAVVGAVAAVAAAVVLGLDGGGAGEQDRQDEDVGFFHRGYVLIYV